MPPPAPPTIPTLKQNFLTTQTRLLSQPLQPSRTWHRANEAFSPDAAARLPEKAVDDALSRLNHTLQQHARRVYAPQATRHVAEQIDKLYMSAADRAPSLSSSGGNDAEEEEGEEGWRNLGADYASAGTIAALPAAWESRREVEAYPLEAKRYAELVARVRELSTRRERAEERVGRLRRMRAVLAPFGGEGEGVEGGDPSGGGGGVQENLVTRGGEVERELERMRMLLVRVGDKVSRLRGREGVDEGGEDLFGDGDAMVVDDVEVEERRKVENLLDGLV